MEKIIKELGLEQDKKARTESYFCNHDNNVTITAEHVQELKQRLQETNGDSIRISLHRNSQDLFHQMIIIHKKGGNFKPHKHLSSEEAHHVIEGRLRIELYNDQGEVINSVLLGDQSTKLPFMFRLRENTWHATVPESDYVIFHESKPGPFCTNDSVFL